ncbi:MAG: hypothetical protein LUF00_13830 [Lachnospiraceae bacterium]|nr:hypothetical protein [Lachnospiraceae bacterium]
MKKENLTWIVMLLVAALAIGTWLNNVSGDAESTTAAETELSTEAATETTEAGET